MRKKKNGNGDDWHERDGYCELMRINDNRWRWYEERLYWERIDEEKAWELGLQMKKLRGWSKIRNKDWINEGNDIVMKMEWNWIEIERVK